MPPKQKKSLLDQQVKDQATLKVLMKDDPEVEEILGSASHVTLYGFDMAEKAWVRDGRVYCVVASEKAPHSSPFFPSNPYFRKTDRF